MKRESRVGGGALFAFKDKNEGGDQQQYLDVQRIITNINADTLIVMHTQSSLFKGTNVMK